MRKFTLALAALGIFGASAAIAAPMPTATNGLSQAAIGDVVQIKMKKKKTKKKMMSGSGMSGGQAGGAPMSGQGSMGGQMGGSPGGQEVKGGTNSPNQGGGR